MPFTVPRLRTIFIFQNAVLDLRYEGGEGREDTDGRVLSVNDSSPYSMDYTPLTYTFDAAGRTATQYESIQRPNLLRPNQPITNTTSGNDYYDGDGFLAKKTRTRGTTTDTTNYIRSSIIGGVILEYLNGTKNIANVYANGTLLAQQTTAYGSSQVVWRREKPLIGDGMDTSSTSVVQGVRTAQDPVHGINAGDADPGTYGASADELGGASASTSSLGGGSPGLAAGASSNTAKCTIDYAEADCGLAHAALEMGGAKLRQTYEDRWLYAMQPTKIVGHWEKLDPVDKADDEVIHVDSAEEWIADEPGPITPHPPHGPSDPGTEPGNYDPPLSGSRILFTTCADTIVLPDKGTDAGALARLIFQEATELRSFANTFEPTTTGASLALANYHAEMQVIGSIPINMRNVADRYPHLKTGFIKAGSSVADAVYSQGVSVQFQGFSSGQTISGSILNRINRALNGPSGSNDCLKLKNAIEIAEGLLDGTLGIVNGIYGMRTAGAGSPGGNYIPTDPIAGSGNQFFTLKESFFPRH